MQSKKSSHNIQGLPFEIPAIHLQTLIHFIPKTVFLIIKFNQITNLKLNIIFKAEA